MSANPQLDVRFERNELAEIEFTLKLLISTQKTWYEIRFNCATGVNNFMNPSLTAILQFNVTDQPCFKHVEVRFWSLTLRKVQIALPVGLRSPHIPYDWNMILPHLTTPHHQLVGRFVKHKLPRPGMGESWEFPGPHWWFLNPWTPPAPEKKKKKKHGVWRRDVWFQWLAMVS